MSTVLARVLLVSINLLLSYGDDTPFSNHQITVCLVQCRYQNTMHESPTEGCHGSGLFSPHSVTCWFGLCKTCSIGEGCEVAVWCVWLPALKNFDHSLQLQYLKTGPLTHQQLVLPTVWGTPVQRNLIAYMTITNVSCSSESISLSCL